MAENVPPASSATDPTRGLPYYEVLKKQLHETIHKKRMLDKNLVDPPAISPNSQFVLSIL